MRRVLSSCRGELGRNTVAARTAGRIEFLRVSVAAAALVLGHVSASRAAFAPINGTLAVRTTAVGPQFAAVTTGPTVQTQAVSSFPNTFELAVASFTGSTVGDRLFDFETSISATTGAPFGMQAVSAASFTQSFTTTGPRWLQLTARVVIKAPGGDPNSATASISLARNGQPATFSINADTGGGQATREGAFAAGTFIVAGLANTTASSVAGARSSVLDGFLLNAAIADFDGNKVVNHVDLNTWKSGFGSLSGTFTSGNLDGDGDADGGDFLLWQRQFGTSAPMAASVATAIPEPASAALALAIVGTLARRRF